MINGMSRRTMERRYKAVTGLTPLFYQQTIRVEEAAKRYLEREGLSFDEITHLVGYQDSCTFRKIFKHHTDLVPSEYRKRFALPIRQAGDLLVQQNRFFTLCQSDRHRPLGFSSPLLCRKNFSETTC
ncbi:MAG: helix-turn-helix domain-containing protein [Deltaproteobacteria bacterium]|nr:helix-turn-helix domain-containing protein [Deltaproteobacteria bacterium]